MFISDIQWWTTRSADWGKYWFGAKLNYWIFLDFRIKCRGILSIRIIIRFVEEKKISPIHPFIRFIIYWFIYLLQRSSSLIRIISKLLLLRKVLRYSFYSFFTFNFFIFQVGSKFKRVYQVLDFSKFLTLH